MRDRTRRERDWFYSRVGLLRRLALALVGLAIAAVLGLVLFGLVRNNVGR